MCPENYWTYGRSAFFDQLVCVLLLHLSQGGKKTALISRRKPKCHGIYVVLTSCPKTYNIIVICRGQHDQRDFCHDFNYNDTLLLLLLLSRFSCVQLSATPQTAAHQAPPSLGFSRQEHWSGLPFPSPMHESEK